MGYTVRRSGSGGAYGDNIPTSVLKWEVREEIEDAVRGGQLSGEVSVGGQAYRWSLDLSHGSLLDYDTGEFLRAATEAEAIESREQAKLDGGAGVIKAGGRRCYVEE